MAAFDLPISTALKVISEVYKAPYWNLQKRIGAAVYYLTGIKRVKSEGQQRGFLSVRRAKNVEYVVGALGFLHNRYQMNFSQSTDWLFSCPKSPCVRGIYNFAKFSVSLISPRKTVQNLSFSLFSGGQEGNYLLRYIFYKPLILKIVCIMLLF